MISSLAAQLAQGASLNAALLVDRSKRKYSESYLFTGREADHHDLYSLHALGHNALLQLKSLNPAFRQFEDSLFSDVAKGTDRTLLLKEKVTELDETISKFLRLLGPYLMDSPTGKVLEWMVRRFRINEFNIDDTLALFLPYHESPHFTKMVTILHIRPQSKWHFLIAHKSAAQHISRSALVTEMLKNSEITRFVVKLLPESVKQGHFHRTLIGFHTSTLLDYISRTKSLDEEILAIILPSILETLQSSPKVLTIKDHILSSYVLLAALSQISHFSQKALRAIITAVATAGSEVLGTTQVINTILSICTPQDQMEKVPSSVIKVIATSPYTNVLANAMAFSGCEKFFIPLLTNLVGRLSEPSAYESASSLLASPCVPSVVIHSTTRVLLYNSVSGDASNSSEQIRTLLSQVRQRHPDVVEQVSQEIIKEDDDLKEKVEQLVLSVSLICLGTPVITGRSSELIIATTDADSAVRAVAVRKLIKNLSNDSLDSTERAEIEATLLARVSDTSVPVIAALYSDPPRIISFLNESYLDLVVQILCSASSSLSRHLVIVHVTFLVTHFASKYLSLTDKIVTEILWPFVMFSKPRQKTVSSVWEVFGSEECCIEITRHELLGGCLDAIKWEEGKDQTTTTGEVPSESHSNTDKMARINLALANRIAENILLSNNYAFYFETLLRKMKDLNSSSRIFSYLTTRALLCRLSGEHQIDAALRVLNVMDIERLDGMDDFMHSSDNLQLFLHDLSLTTCIVLKPSSKTTTNRLKASMLSMFPTMSRPLNTSFDWLAAALQDESSESRGARYVKLQCSVYRLAITTTFLPVFSAHLLRAQFVSLKDDALTFLAGLWASPATLDGEYRVQQSALHHAAAFLFAHLSTQSWVDFQTVLPLFLYALDSPKRTVREAAVDCVNILEKMCEAEKPTAIYGFDTIYGENSGHLQYLEWADLKKYIGIIAEHKHHFVNDSGYIRSFQQQCLVRQKSDSKKESAFKRRIICYLLSHVNACNLPVVKLGLLSSLNEVSDASKVQMLLPAMQDIFVDSPSPPVVSPFGLRLEEFASLLGSCFDSNLAKALNDPTGQVWPVFVQALKQALSSESAGSLRNVLAQNMEQGLFKRLSYERQVEVCQILLEAGTSKAESNLHCKSMLASVLDDIPVVLHLIKLLQPVASESVPPATKRAKLDSSKEESTGTETLSQLTLLSEVLGSRTFEGSIDLISGLLDTLSKVVHCGESASRADLAYLEQLLMSTVENIANSVKPADVSQNAIKVEVLVEIIRVSDNPQTFHQALLLVSSLTRLAPEAVLRNVMPVFTFMGSNVFHRDDTYSFKVVQKTVDGIVPVMVSSLKNAHSDPFKVQLASKDFLTIFTDAAHHIPRHRRTSFFSHLVEVLGASEFLAPVCMLLVDKVANRIVRQSASDTQNSLATALALIQHYSPKEQIDVLIQVLQETKRIVSNLRKSGKPETTFLESSIQSDDEGIITTSTRRAQALIIFTDSVFKQMQPLATSRDTGVTKIISLLLDVSSVDQNIEKIFMVSRVCLISVLNILPAADFVTSILGLMESADTTVQVGAYDLFADRLFRMTDKSRQEVTPTINKILKRIRNVLSESSDDQLKSSTLKSMRAIGNTTCTGEENSLNDVLPIILKLIADSDNLAEAMSALSSISVKLGPRIIPNFRKIVQECVRISSEELREGDKQPSSLATDSMQVLQDLLAAIPSFWTNEEIVPVINMYLQYEKDGVVLLAALGKSVAKRVPSNTLLPALFAVFKSWETSEFVPVVYRRVAFFGLLKKSLHAASRSEVQQYLRALFNIFLQAFDTSAMHVDQAKQQTIAAFLELVVKLNETAFRPLFRKLYDWAFTNDPDSNRQVVFCHVYVSLLDYFKGLMTPYMIYTTDSFLNLLNSFKKSSTFDSRLWLCIMETFDKTFLVDEGSFWRDDKLRSLASPLISQIPICVSQSETAKAVLTATLSNFGSIVNDENLLKSVNLEILMQTRSEDPRQRILALDCAQQLWTSSGTKLLGFVAETATFIAELAEDENDTVVRKTRELKLAVEQLAGKINNL